MKDAFVFPGQGSQSIGMLKDLAAAYPLVEETFGEASDALGYDLWALTQNGPEAELNTTERTQPAMLTAGVALWRLWLDEGGEWPIAMAGHSLGEYTALVCAEALPFPEAVTLVAERGRLMQSAVPEGAGTMAAILGLSNAQIAEVCEAAAQGDVVSPANYNSPGQVVIAGATDAVVRAVEAAGKAGARRAVTLAVSVPSHCELMRPAAEQLAERLRTVNLVKPRVPVWQNADAKAHDEPEAIRDALIRQLHSPVQWESIIRAMAEQGVGRIVECGPGKVLAGLNKRIDRDLQSATLADPASFEKALQD